MTVKILETTVLESEIIGVSPVYSTSKDTYGLHYQFSFDVYTKQNTIPIKTDSFVGQDEAVRQKLFEEIKLAHSEVLNLLDRNKHYMYTSI